MSQPSPGPAVTAGVLKETTPGEQRMAVVPESVLALARAGVRVLVESGAGAAAWFPDGAYTRAGAKVVSRDEVVGRAGVLVAVGAPAPELIARLRPPQDRRTGSRRARSQVQPAPGDRQGRTRPRSGMPVG
jgi:NAD/NADP transhydrogenase alpha subunit